jgi:predicted cupin superfamily sugar epimerase
MPATQSLQAGLIEQLVARFGLIPHPEGGFYRETYRATQRVVRVSGNDTAHQHASNARPTPAADLSASTAILYLLSGDAYSAWHRIGADEGWHFYAGCPVDVHVLRPDGGLTSHRLGNALERDDAVFQAVVPARCWFAAERIDTAGYALLGCTVAPGFEFREFELADTGQLLATHPSHAALVGRLGRRR